MKNFSTRIAYPLIIAAAAVSASPVAMATAPVNQGDGVLAHGTYLNGAYYVTNDCTVGYVQQGKAWLAAHCANDGDKVYNLSNEEIGVMRKVNPGDGQYRASNDLAYVELSAPTGQNRYSNTLNISGNRYGDEVCTYSRKSNQVVCGSVVSVNSGAVNDTVRVDDHATSFGDSGGPAWNRDKGFVGLISGQTDKADSEAIITVTDQHILTPHVGGGNVGGGDTGGGDVDDGIHGSNMPSGLSSF